MFPGLFSYREKQNNKVNKTTTKPTKNIEVSRRSFLPQLREEQGTMSLLDLGRHKSVRNKEMCMAC